MTDESTTLLRPKARRPFDVAPTSAESSSPPTPSRNPSDSSKIEPESSGDTPATSARHTRSILNLTSSTLFGIYSPGYESNREEPSTPWGNGSRTPSLRSADDTRPPVLGAYQRPQLLKYHSHQHQHHSSFWGYFLPLGFRTLLLFSFGVAYGVIISHLHDSQRVAPVQFEGIGRGSWWYLMGWGAVGVLLGRLLPWVDILWEEVLGDDKSVFASKATAVDSRITNPGSEEDEGPASRPGSDLGADWNPVVRSIGAFIGIAFAIVSNHIPIYTKAVDFPLTLIKAQTPMAIHIPDRSKPGFILSMLVGLAGTAIAFGFNPEIVPSPATPSPRAGSVNVSYDSGMHNGLISNESIGVGTWIASVLFCSSVCFGNIGRRLALDTPNRRSSVS
ncbi:hypothetical protein MMC28_002802 [Mycoblastus sanguinarius]|nr:hypothetical protein [Mycoblastus sanguinarius]